MASDAKRPRSGQHSARNVDAIDATLRSHGYAHVREVPAGPAPDLEDVVACVQVEPFHGLAAKACGLKQQPLKQWNEAGNPIVTSGDRAAVLIDPFRAAALPKFAADSRAAPHKRQCRLPRV
jgi:hypothetical protein